jgi:hypothetical protein
VDVGADAKTTTRMRKRKNNKKKKKEKRKIETHTWLRGSRRRGFSQRLQPPPDSQPQLNILERPDAR